MKDDDKTISRRQLVGGAAALGAASALPATASAQGARAQARRAPTRTDPRSKHPKPPFPSQSQPWPGLAGKMVPRPDHGETSYVGSGRLGGRRALITGGDSGMGRAAAIAYAREGADVAINYLAAEEPDARVVVALIRQAGRKAVAIPGDIRTERFCNQLVARSVRDLGGLDILVLNAARQQAIASLEEVTADEFDFTMKVNIYAPFWIAKAALPSMGVGSSIIITASEQAESPSADLVQYALTKAANVNFAKSLAKQLGPRGIRVNAVAPGPIWTPLQVSGGATQEKLQQFGGDTPLGRPGQPAELASIYVQLAADDASYANGAVYGANGGA